MEEKRDQWSSKFGFIMSAAGSAVGLGNIWKFPYLCGTNGGALFLIAYIVFIILLGYPILMTELAIGRNGGMNAVDSCRKISGKWGFAGGFGVAGSVLVLAYYCVVGGWIMQYFLLSITGNIPSSDYFTAYSSSTVPPIIMLTIFIIINAVIVMFGVSKGIEKVSTILLPLLIVFLAGLLVYSLTLPNASEGVKFFLMPDFSGINSVGDFFRIIITAMGQVFFSLSLGMGTLITYGSYLEKNSSLSSSTVSIVTIDTMVAIMSGLTILPAVFSVGLAPNAGPGLIFSTLTAVFADIKAGSIISSLFFLLVFFAAITSSISLLEVVVSFLTERFGLSRFTAVLIPSLIITALSILSSLSYGALADMKIMGMTFFELMIFLSDQVIMPLGGFFLCILAGHIWGTKNLCSEITADGKFPFRPAPFYRFVIKYAAPAMIIIIFVTSIISADNS